MRVRTARLGDRLDGYTVTTWNNRRLDTMTKARKLKYIVLRIKSHRRAMMRQIWLSGYAAEQLKKPFKIDGSIA